MEFKISFLIATLLGCSIGICFAELIDIWVRHRERDDDHVTITIEPDMYESGDNIDTRI